ncbi:16S rRNA (guanine(527)-N(7))-methyltransferase RsmG [Paludifilum halophilum]|uniref:Ribosomal RNA small subunit methyltransferase G n=1 Tax=Paludifilum halophilum TaxID=1642702 RepID=A0A235B7H6_9BACL|nr:16S rRNA (guanine(527)-N(7))-methyltransferase RsmG [Paludifilum halophilum]OYD08191.1 16S rRNA (guanine(527)-N(7))-methyltransferase RsmG [Paludifilum halophilum]
MDYRYELGEQMSKWGLHLSDEQWDRFALYFRRLTETNQKMNLTAITEEKEVYIKHFYDSLTLVSRLPMDEIDSVIDVGTGAGFPGLPLKIAYPRIRLVLLDSLKKRIVFLKELAQELELEDVETIHGRAEETARDPLFRERFDLATARAVAKLNVLSEYCFPFVRVGGRFVAMKGPDVETEVQGAKRAVQRLGGGGIHTVSFSLPEEMGNRNILILPKENPTPKAYPRKPGTPLRQPLT